MEKVTKGILLEVITSLVGLGGTSIQVLVVVPGFFFVFFFNFYLFIYGCVGSSFLCEGFL